MAEFYGCTYCGNDEVALTKYCGDWVCEECIDCDLFLDVESYEEQRRKRLFEEQEY